MIQWFDTLWALLAWLLLSGILIFTIYAIIQSWIEKEFRAVKRLVLTFLVLGFFHALLFIFLPDWTGDWIFILYVLGLLSLLILILAPWPVKTGSTLTEVPPRVDERTIMFSRSELEPGSDRFKEYYQNHPEHVKTDNEFRSSPGLLDKNSLFYHPLLFSAAEASFFTVEALQSRTDGPVENMESKTDPQNMWRFINSWALEMDCHSIAVTLLKPEHLYTVGGRRHNYNEIVENNHSHAIVFTVEMDADRVAASPRAPIIQESSYQYLKAGMVAVQIAAFLRKNGFPATAHIDGKYQVRCPQIARDAGLGELGRMSLLMTPKLGPRVRIGVVTTSAPLPLKKIKPDHSMIRFCRICKKCADTCPSQALSFAHNESVGGEMQWTVNQEKCFNYWCKIGTDCGRCIAVCPFSHPNNLFHNIVRFFIKTSPIFSRLALYLDNSLYGRKPPSRDLPKWMEVD